MILASKKDPRADAAADRALAIDAKSWMVLNAKTTAALLAKRYAEAESYHSRSLAIEPKYIRSRAGRGTSRMMLGTDHEGALADQTPYPAAVVEALIGSRQSRTSKEDAKLAV